MKRTIALAAGAALALAATTAPAQQQGSQLASGVCSACHGPNGHSISPVFPNLAGQQSAYIVLQLDAFRGKLRGDPNAQAYMWGMASQLSDATIKSLAQYYSSQKPAPGVAGDPALMSEGKTIFTQGIAQQGVPACASCHGENAQGNGPFPRLGGQHVEYLVAQLQGFKSGVRANAPIMTNVVKTMSDQQLRAAATYAASK